MKNPLLVILLLMSLFSGAFGFEVFVNSGIKNSRPITTLHLKNPVPFTCLVGVQNATKYYECELKGKSKLIADQSLKEFDLKFISQKDKLVVQILPKFKSYMFSSDNILHDKDRFVPRISKVSRHFVFIFDENLSIEQKRYNGLDFKMDFPKVRLPYIGALDLDQHPVSFSKSNDVNAFIQIKRAYDAKRYQEAIEDVQRAMRKYPDSIFTKDFMLYLMRAQLALSSQTNEYLPFIIEQAKSYMRMFPSDGSYTEILSILVKAYLKIEQKGDAEYFLDILSSEHKDDYFTKLAKIDYADYLQATNRADDATKLYNDVLFSTNNAYLISRAATALARINISQNKLNLAKEYIQKVLSLSEEYILLNQEQSYKMANDFFNAGFYDVAVVIYQKLYDHSSKADSYYESVVLNLAKSYLYANDATNAKKYLKDYQVQFPNGDYLSEIEQMLDRLYLQDKSATSKELHEFYKSLMDKYQNDIARRALEEEIKLLYKEKQFEKILDYTDLVSEYEIAQDLLYQSVVWLVNDDLDNDECTTALKLTQSYEIKDEDIKDYKTMLGCYMRTQNYQKAMDFIAKHYEEDEIYYKLNELRILYLTGDYARIIKDIALLQRNRHLFERFELFDLYYYKALAHLHLGEYNDAIFALKRLESSGDEFKIVEVYDEFLDYFMKHKMIDSVLNYGTKSVDLQNKIGVNLYSPKHEFILLWALIERQEYKKARATLDDLFKLELSDDDLTKAKYLSGELYEASGELKSAIAEYKACKSGQYKSLCDEKLEVLDENR